MSTDSLKIDSLKVPLPDQPEPLSRNSGTQGTATSSSASADQIRISAPRQHKHLDIQEKKDEYAARADAVRREDEGLRELGQKVGALKAPLQGVVKQFPPYGPEDQERVKLMRHYATLRREIDALTVPRPQGEEPVALPAPLSRSATDSQINDHLRELDAASAGFAAQRQSLASSAASLASEGGALGGLSPGKGGGERLLLRDMAPAEAVQKSVDIGQQFASRTGQGLVTSDSQFLRSLG